MLTSKQSFLLLLSIVTVIICFAQGSPDSLEVFEEFKADSAITSHTNVNALTTHAKKSESELYWVASVLLFTLLVGVLVRFKRIRAIRSLFLVGSLIVFGFYRGGCPCSIQGFQNSFLLLLDHQLRWPSILIFLGLLPLTYFFGRVYCGWICHLGALQELIFTSSSSRFFQSERSQKIMRYIRFAALAILITQLLITHTILYKYVDPFAVVFNFYSEFLVGWILVGIIIGSSLLIYRPFCKTICPIGLVLGWISKIPRASVVGPKEGCINCNLCTKTCNIRAITHDSKITVINSEECIRCGQCIDSCKKNAINFFSNSRSHPSKIIVKA